MVAFGISYPCTTFDKWRLIPVVSDRYDVVSGDQDFLLTPRSPIDSAVFLGGVDTLSGGPGLLSAVTTMTASKMIGAPIVGWMIRRREAAFSAAPAIGRDALVGEAKGRRGAGPLW